MVEYFCILFIHKKTFTIASVLIYGCRKNLLLSICANLYPRNHRSFPIIYYCHCKHINYRSDTCNTSIHKKHDNISNRMYLLTQSLPKRRWIPTKGPSVRRACIKLSAKSAIFSDHLKYCCKCLLCLATGKLPGAPESASTGCLATGNLQTVQA